MSQEQSTPMTKNINPATWEEIGTFPENTVEELSEAVQNARSAQAIWGAKSFNERRSHLLKIRDYIAQNADEIAAVISKATGKTRNDAMSTEALPAAMAVNFYAKHAQKILKDKTIKPGNLLTANKWSVIQRAPYGVVGIISPWNYPFAIPVHEIAMGLIAGNAVILKVASHTISVGKMIERCIAAGELPEGLFNHINMPGRLAGDAFIRTGIDKLFFTGSVPVGKYLMKKAAERLLPVSLELGGNDAMIVFNDADIERAAGGALWAGFSNAGQSCAGVERIYIESPIYDQFTMLLKKKMNTLRVGPDTDFEVEIGSLTTAEQFNTVQIHIRDAMEKGALLSFGQPKSGENNIGYFISPVIVENVNDDMLMMKEETFGPVLALERFETENEAVEKMNNSSLGLTSSVWTKDRQKGMRIAAKLETGTVMINDHLMSHGLAETPWGGWKDSGLGRTHGALGLEAMTQPRTIVKDILPMLKKNMWWHPHSRKTYDAMKGALEALYHQNLALRLEGLNKVTRLFLQCFRSEKK